jgi:hypothetical protein
MTVKKTLSLLIGVSALFAVVAQFYLMFEITTVSTAETTIRFFSYFTILTNSLVAISFLWMFSRLNRLDSERTLHIPSYYTAITVYILVVGLIYQIILRPLWKPEGFNKIVDELLHTVVPLCTFIFWLMYGRTKTIPYSSIPLWLLYPVIYLIYIIIRGYFSDFYPYPFIDVTALGQAKVAINALLVAALFSGLMTLFIFINNRTVKDADKNTQR